VLPGTWPAQSAPPPANANYTSLVDRSKIRNAPLNQATPNCPATDTYCYWTCTLCTRNDTDIIRCPNSLDWGLTLDDGHQIAVHTWSHTALTTQSTEVVIAELKYTSDAIKAAVNVTPKYMRPPFGDYDDRIRDIATQLGMKPTIWDLDSNDWMSADDPTFQLSWIAGNFNEWVSDPTLKRTGHISLEHDLYNQTAAQIPLVVPILLKANYSIKTVHNCVGDSSAYVEMWLSIQPALTI
ncbi:3604_t:CDS:2, partial [Gigaspora rosea]